MTYQGELHPRTFLIAAAIFEERDLSGTHESVKNFLSQEMSQVQYMFTFSPGFKELNLSYSVGETELSNGVKIKYLNFRNVADAQVFHRRLNDFVMGMLMMFYKNQVSHVIADLCDCIMMIDLVRRRPQLIFTFFRPQDSVI